MPTWSIVPSRFWKAQVPYLARHFRVVTFDGRGSGASGRPAGAAAYTDHQFAADTVAVLDAAGSTGPCSSRCPAGRPGRCTWRPTTPTGCRGCSRSPRRAGSTWPTRRDHVPWAARCPPPRVGEVQPRYWLDGGYDDFLRFFFGQMFTEPHSTKQLEDCVAWGHEISPQTLVDVTAGRLAATARSAPTRGVCARVTQPGDGGPRRRRPGTPLASASGWPS